MNYSANLLREELNIGAKPHAYLFIRLMLYVILRNISFIRRIIVEGGNRAVRGKEITIIRRLLSSRKPG